MIEEGLKTLCLIGMGACAVCGIAEFTSLVLVALPKIVKKQKENKK